MNFKKMFVLEFFLTAVILISSVYGFDIDNSTNSSILEQNMVCFTMPTTWMDFIGIDSSVSPVEGFIVAFFIVFIFSKLFYYVLKKAKLFSETITLLISVLLAMMLIPIGFVTQLNDFVLQFVSGSTATLLYIFIFVYILGQGYVNKFESEKKDKQDKRMKAKKKK